jgi:H+/Cl- antiporter ClcA
MSEPNQPQGDVESLLRTALRPIEPPETLPERVEGTLSAVTEAAADELSAWADELSESELAALRDPRNWVRPATAAAAGGLAGGALLLLELRRRRRPHGASALAEQLRSRLP